MARFIGLFFCLSVVQAPSLLGHGTVQVKFIGDHKCLFMGACDAHGKTKGSLNITKHVPLGLEVFGNTRYGRQNLAYLCEGGTVGILYDCNNRIPLFVATVIHGSQLSGAPGNGPRGQLILSKSGLDKY